MSHIGSNSLVFPSGLGAGGSDIAISPTAPVSPAIGDLWQNSGATTVSGVDAGKLAFWNGTLWIEIAEKKIHLDVRSTVSQVMAGAGLNFLMAFNFINNDTNSAWNVALNSYTIPEDGIYNVTNSIFTIVTSNSVNNAGTTSVLYVNGVPDTRLGSNGSWASFIGVTLGSFPRASISKRFLAGDIITIRVFNGTSVSTSTTVAGTLDNFLTITKIGDI